MLLKQGVWIALACVSLAGAVNGPAFPDPEVDQMKPAAGKSRQVAVFAGGCFWCTEAVFEHVKGVEKVISGFAGGSASTANYHAVGEGKTEHAESIAITYDPSRITFGQLLKVFFSVAHDPTQVNRQGPDWGRQYRSAVFYQDDEQKRVAEAYIAQLNAAKVFPKPIATELKAVDKFYMAEPEHQNFVRDNPMHPYVRANSLPKLDKLKKLYPDWHQNWK